MATTTMKPRALILDMFGDYLRYVDSEVRASDLVTLLAALGVEPATTRVTLSRLRQEGWFTTRRVGRETIYRLSDELLVVLDEGRSRIFEPYADEWDGAWTQVIFQLDESDRSVREQLKKRLSWLGFGSLTMSTWLTPGDQRVRAHRLRGEFPSATVDVLLARSDSVDGDRSLADRCWDLVALNADYERFIVEHAVLGDSVAELDGAAALAARTELVSTYRHFPFRDPSLPLALRPAGWRGAHAHGLFLATHGALAPAATEYVESVIGAPIGNGALVPENV
ncbi:PaaX family transcriptional regulator [Labedella phragmitis]|nr:PaaX family transcriptional regulator C-terminal domain-containing protein [Labedella phragmitis]